MLNFQENKNNRQRTKYIEDTTTKVSAITDDIKQQLPKKTQMMSLTQRLKLISYICILVEAVC